MQDLRREKLDCRVIFGKLVDGRFAGHLGPFEAIAEIVTHQYDDKVTFWYGVMDVVVPPSEIVKHLGSRLMYGDIKLFLGEGREVIARQFGTGNFSWDILGEQHALIPFMGATPMAAPRPLPTPA